MTKRECDRISKDDRERLEKAIKELKDSFLSDKNGLWFLFGIWVGFLIIGICYLLGLIK